jgi:hypothetical protein
VDGFEGCGPVAGGLGGGPGGGRAARPAGDERGAAGGRALDLGASSTATIANYWPRR